MIFLRRIILSQIFITLMISSLYLTTRLHCTGAQARYLPLYHSGLILKPKNKACLTINQLMNTIRLSSDKKDKICLISNNVVVMVTKEDTRTIDKFVSRIKGNLPGMTPIILKKLYLAFLCWHSELMKQSKMRKI